MKPGDILTALALLTRLPGLAPADHARGAKAAWAYPLVGLVLALIATGISLVAFWAGLTPALVAALALTALIAMTGAMHEDGLADSADGLWGGWTIERRLEIMKDSRIGTYGVLALGLSLLIRWAALTALFGHGQILGPMVATAALSRAACPVLMAALPHARSTGLSHATGRASRQSAAVAAAIAALLCLLTMTWAGLPALVVAGLATLGVCALAKAKVGGQTGDILGAGQQVTEIAVLLALVAALP